jgi:hypothetical protein
MAPARLVVSDTCLPSYRRQRSVSRRAQTPGQVYPTSHQREDGSARALPHSVLEGIQDSHIEMREIAFVSSGHGEAVHTSRGGYHGILT